MYPKARIEALSDGIFAVAMTILILDVRLPDDLHPSSSDALLLIVTSALCIALSFIAPSDALWV